MSDSSTKNGHPLLVDTGRSDAVWAVTFHPDGMDFLSGNGDGVRRWRIADGREMGSYTGMNLNAVVVSRDHKWIVCGTQRGASVWDAEKEEKVVEVEKKQVVAAVDVSPDSTRFATGTVEVNIWNIATGQRTLGPLDLDNDVRGLRFSPNGKLVATACEHDDVRVFDSHNGDQLVAIKTIVPSFYPITPLAWSNDGEKIFATSVDNKVRSFDVSTGSQLAESPILDSPVESIALARNGKFLATFASRSISFLDTSALVRIGPAIEDGDDIRSIALSPHSTHLATGQYKGKIAVRSLRNLLPASYGPFYTEEQQEDEQLLDANSETRNEDADNDLLELELPTSTPRPLFNYDEPPSPGSSTHSNRDKVLPLGRISQPLDALPVTSPPGACLPENFESSKDTSARKGWLTSRLRRKSKDPTSPEPAVQSRPKSNKRVSVMAEGRRQRRSVAKSIPPQPKPLVKAVAAMDSTRDASNSNPTQHVPDVSQLFAKTINVTHQRESGRATISLTLPAWMLCFRSGAEDGMH